MLFICSEGKIAKLLFFIFLLLLGTLFIIPNDTRWNAWFDAIKHVNNLVSDVNTVKTMKKNLKDVCEFLKVPALTS
jgi:hypothetical protein